MKFDLKALLTTLSESSSWAGFSGIALALGVAQPQFALFTSTAAAVCGLLAVVIRENSNKKVN